MEQLLIIYHLSLTLNLILPTASDQITNPNFRTFPTLGDRAFIATAPKVRNSPPLDLRRTSDFEDSPF